MSNTKNKPQADELFCKRCKATSGVFFRGLCGNCWVERAEIAEKALREILAEAQRECPALSSLIRIVDLAVKVLDGASNR